MFRLTRHYLFILCLMFGASIAFITASQAQLVVDVTAKQFKPIPVAITDFLSVDKTGAEISQIISADLERSGLFQPIASSAFLERITNPDAIPRYNDWQQIDAQALVTGRVLMQPNGQFRVDFRLWDVFKKQQLEGRYFVSSLVTAASKRRIAHQIADIIYEKMTGESGYFDTRIVFIDETGPRNKRIKRLAIMDQDGANVGYLSNGQELIVTPRFSPSQQEITYMAYGRDSVPRVYLQQIESGQRESVPVKNMTIAPRFSSDGQKLIMSLLQDNGSSNLYVMDMRGHTVTRLTSTMAIDTSASYSPDGHKIVFGSDRSGKPKLYVMNSDGSNQRLISYGDGSYSTPVWSPKGDYIAFTKQVQGKFYIGVIRPDGSEERILTSGFHNEGPTWSPNGKVIMFFRQEQGKGPKLYTINISGRNERQLPTPNDASDPAWSPLLK